jgi:guanylate kinase
MMGNEKKFIFVFTGPDGSGRKTVADAAGLTLGLRKVISYTTRNKRPIEENGQDYHFVTDEDFLRGIAQNEFMEHLIIGGYRYGVKRQDINDAFAASSIYFIMNRYGTDEIARQYGEQVVRIFLYADRNTVKQRQQRDGLSQAEIDRHLARYDEEMAYGPNCEHQVENIGDLGHTVFHVTNLLESYLDRGLIDKD